MWEVIYWEDSHGGQSIEKWLDSLTKEQFKSVAKEVILLERLGNELRLPHSKSLGKGLFELRERKFGYRLYYCFEKSKTILLLCTGSKTTQEKDIQMARQRMDAL